MNSQLIISSALRTIELEAQSVSGLATFINKDFVNAVEHISASKGRLVISGIGKSAVIAQKRKIGSDKYCIDCAQELRSQMALSDG